MFPNLWNVSSHGNYKIKLTTDKNQEHKYSRSTSLHKTKNTIRQSNNSHKPQEHSKSKTISLYRTKNTVKVKQSTHVKPKAQLKKQVSLVRIP